MSAALATCLVLAACTTGYGPAGDPRSTGDPASTVTRASASAAASPTRPVVDAGETSAASCVPDVFDVRDVVEQWAQTHLADDYAGMFEDGSSDPVHVVRSTQDDDDLEATRIAVRNLVRDINPAYLDTFRVDGADFSLQELEAASAAVADATLHTRPPGKDDLIAEAVGPGVSANGITIITQHPDEAVAAARALDAVPAEMVIEVNPEPEPAPQRQVFPTPPMRNSPSGAAPIHLYVAFETRDFGRDYPVRVFIDDELVVDGVFAVGPRSAHPPVHRYEFSLEPGLHELVARSCGGPRVDEEFDAAGPRWIVLTIKDRATLEWQVHDQPIFFG